MAACRKRFVAAGCLAFLRGKENIMPELLSPAGNFEKLRAALLYGADAVYLAGQRFGMRSAADNFTLEELYAASEYVHERGKKLYPGDMFEYEGNQVKIEE